MISSFDCTIALICPFPTFQTQRIACRHQLEYPALWSPLFTWTRTTTEKPPLSTMRGSGLVKTRLEAPKPAPLL
jgi:hypothetical protein